MAFIARLSSSALSMLLLLFRAIKGEASRKVTSTWENRLLVPGEEGDDHVATVSSHKRTLRKKFHGNVWVAINMILSQRWNGKGSWQPLNHRSNVRWKRTGQLWTKSEKKVLLILNTPSPTGFTLAFPLMGSRCSTGL